MVNLLFWFAYCYETIQIPALSCIQMYAHTYTYTHIDTYLWIDWTVEMVSIECYIACSTVKLYVVKCSLKQKKNSNVALFCLCQVNRKKHVHFDRFAFFLRRIRLTAYSTQRHSVNMLQNVLAQIVRHGWCDLHTFPYLVHKPLRIELKWCAKRMKARKKRIKIMIEPRNICKTR